MQQRPPVGMIGGARLRVLLEVADDSACFSKSRMKGGGPVPPTAATQRRVWSRPERAAPRAQPPPRGRAEQERSPREASTVTPEEPSAPHPSDEIVPCVTAGPRLAACCYWLMGARWRWATGERWANGAAQAAGLRRFRPAMHRRCCARTPGAPRGGACSPRARSGCELRAIQWLRVLGAVLAPSRREPDRSRARNASGARGRSAAGGLYAPPAVRGPGAKHARGAGNVRSSSLRSAAGGSAPLRRRRGGRFPCPSEGWRRRRRGRKSGRRRAGDRRSATALFHTFHWQWRQGERRHVSVRSPGLRSPARIWCANSNRSMSGCRPIPLCPPPPEARSGLARLASR